MGWKQFWQGVRQRLAGEDLTWREPLEFRRLRHEFQWRSVPWWKRPLAVASLLGGIVAQHFWQFLPGSPNHQWNALLYIGMVVVAIAAVYGERHLLRWMSSTIKMTSSSISRSGMFRRKSWNYDRMESYQISENGSFETLILYPKKGSPEFFGIGKDVSHPKIKALLRMGGVRNRAGQMEHAV